MEAAQHAQGADADLGAVAEAWTRAWDRQPSGRGGAQGGGPAERAEADHGAQTGEDQRELAVDPRRAGVALLGRGLVLRRGTPDGRHDAGAEQLEAVIRMGG